ncbi:MAG: glycosyltransferase family 4 protein [Anaerolineae bacterium]|nr:glycosyltransferase family 4 protein [Anaerolineae bacterium]
MLVGIDASRAVSTHPTGTETYARRLIEALLARPPHRFRLYFRSAPPAGSFSAAEWRVIPFPRLWTHVRLSWEMERHPPDVLFVPAHVLPPVRPALSLVTVHDLGYLHFPQAHPFRQRLYLDLSTRWSARAATRVIADSQATRADLIAQYGVPAEKIVVAYPGYDEGLTRVDDPALIVATRARYAIPERYVLYLGTLQPRKNLSRLIDAFADVPRDVTLVLAGRRGWLSDDTLAQAQRLGLEQRVLFPGYVSEGDKAALLSGALAFAFPSLYEGFGLPVLEAQACGCPVVCANTSSLPEVAGSGALLLDPHDTRAWSQALAQLTGDAVLRTEWAARGHANLPRFSWSRCADTVLETIETLAASS